VVPKIGRVLDRLLINKLSNTTGKASFMPMSPTEAQGWRRLRSIMNAMLPF